MKQVATFMDFLHGEAGWGRDASRQHQQPRAQAFRLDEKVVQGTLCASHTERGQLVC